MLAAFSAFVVGAPVALAETALERLLAHKREHGTVPTERIRAVADLLGKSEDTIWRWLRQQHLPTKREPFALNDSEERLLAACGNNVKLMHDQLVAQGDARAGVRTYQRAANLLSPVYAGVLRGRLAGLAAEANQRPARRRVARRRIRARPHTAEALAANQAATQMGSRLADRRS